MDLKIFDRLKLRNKIITILAIQTTLLIIFGLLGFNISFSTYKNQLYGQTSQIVNLLSDNVENKLKRICDLSFEAITDNTIQSNLIKINEEKSPYQKLQISTTLRSKLLQYSFSEKYIASIGIIDQDNNQYFEGLNNSNISLNKLSEIRNSPTINDGKVIWIKPSADNDEILAVRSIRQINDFSFSSLGLLVIKINPKKLLEGKFEYFSSMDYYFSVFSKNSIIFEHKDQFVLDPFTFGIIDNKGYFFKKINNMNYFIYYSTFDYTDWQFAFAFPVQNIMLEISKVQVFIVLAYLIIFLFTTYIVIRFSSRIVRPLEKLMLNLQEAKNQWFNSDEYSNYLSNITFKHSKDKDEIRFLERDFKLLIDRINCLVKENYDEKIMVKEWQLKALQRQINPHFLYNTLDSIYWLSKMNNQDQISTIIKSLGNLLRNSIYKSDYIISLGEEIGILKDYINIQKFRFQDRLKINIDIDETFLNQKIPNLTIQTLVENSISYALEVKPDDCSISIFSNYENDDIRITIIDNGPGVSPDMLGKLQRMEIEPNNSGIGIKNIDQRIKLIFGDRYGLFLDSEQNKWFRVDILIPCNTDMG